MLLMLPASVAVHGASSVENAGALSDLLSDYKTYQADFTQTVRRDSGKQVQKSTGEVKAHRGGDFFWHTDPPLEQVIVTAGDRVKVYDPDLLQVTVYPMKERIASTPALLLSGDVTDLASSFEISRESGDSGDVFTLKPREQDTLFVALEMVFEDGVLREMRLDDSLDQHSRLRFDNVVLNESIKDSVFELDVPDNVDVIRNREEAG